jgi:hypothetical protein
MVGGDDRSGRRREDEGKGGVHRPVRVAPQKTCRPANPAQPLPVRCLRRQRTTF